jgi:Mn-dependent DtxR family transcriptional regulator
VRHPALTSRSIDYLRAIHELTARLRYAPSVSEVGAMCGTCVSTAHGAVERLVRDGYVVRDYGTARSLRLTESGLSAITQTEETTAP